MQLRMFFLVYLFAGYFAANRFKGHKYFYYIFAVAASDPLMYLLRKIVTIDNTVYFTLIKLFILFTIPKLDYKKRIITSIALVLTILHYNYSPLVFLIIHESILLMIIFVLLDDFYSELKSVCESSVFLLLFSMDNILSATFAYLAIEDISSLLSMYYWLLSLNILVFVLIAVIGPKTKINLNFLKHFNFNFNKFSQVISDAAGNIVLTYHQKTDNINQRIYREIGSNDSALTKREVEVLTFLSNGLSNTEIANNLCVDKRTVENHLQHVKEKLGYSSMQELRRSARNHL